MTTISKAVLLKALEAAVKRADKKASTSNYAQGKAYELKVLADIVTELRVNHGYLVSCTPKASTHLTFGGSPCKPNGAHHDHIQVQRGSEDYELWISVQFTTLSYALGGGGAAPVCSDLHELDIGLYQSPLGSNYPSYNEVVFAASCKAGTWHKVQAREALGLRRELGVLTDAAGSLAAWFEPYVPTHPASPLALYSRDLNALKYSGSLASLGLYIRHHP
ncbi:hypothetical protein [Pseudoxanthomonas wuyuanensis]